MGRNRALRSYDSPSWQPFSISSKTQSIPTFKAPVTTPLCVSYSSQRSPPRSRHPTRSEATRSKDVVDEIVFRAQDPRNRLILELMARGCMRIGEVLKLTPTDIEDRKVVIRDRKSGKETEVVFLPKKVFDRLKTYVRENGIRPNTRIFPITYAAARIIA